MFRIKKWRFECVLIAFCVLIGTLLFILYYPELGLREQERVKQSPAVRGPSAHTRSFKILHIMSYHSPWQWTDQQFKGFKDALAGVNVEYRVFQMDAKAHSSEEWKQAKGWEARQMIEQWQPDLVYASDDEAQQYITRYYINADLPFVFSGVNKRREIVGFAASKNITGVLEEEHFAESIKLLTQIAPQTKRIAVIYDNSSMWEPVIERMKVQATGMQQLEFVAWDTVATFAEYKQKIREYEQQADAICSVSLFTFKDDAGNNVPYQEVLRWTVANSRLPDVSFWLDRVAYGNLCAVYVSAYDQGLAAGKIAAQILIEGRSPADFPITITTKGLPCVNLARAKDLGLRIHSKILLGSTVITQYAGRN